MNLTAPQIAAVVAALTIMVIAAHVASQAFRALRQPAVIAEILVGLALGPSLLGLLAPGIERAIFPTSGAVAAVLAGVAQLGLFLLMFVTGGEMRFRVHAPERRAVSWIAMTGLVLPFLAGFAVLRLVDRDDLAGPRGTDLSTTLVFGIAVAVTSIPVISRIMLDLGLLGGSFARVVLAIATLEDVVLYAVLAVVLSLTQGSSGTASGLWALVGDQSTTLTIGYHVAASLVFLAATLAWGPRIARAAMRSRWNPIARYSPVATMLALLLLAVLLCNLLDVNPVFGALLAGTSINPRESPARLEDTPGGQGQAWSAIRQFSLAFFVPVYFVSVGLKLDVVHQLDLVFFGWFFLLASVVKMVGVGAGALLSGQPRGRAVDLAVALNARGGPGIVLATVTFAAGVINEAFFTSIVLLSVLTSQLAGAWLRFRLPLLSDEPAAVPSPSERAERDMVRR